MSIRITDEQKAEAVKAYQQYGNLSLVGKLVKVSRSTLQREMTRSSNFKEKMGEAKEEYVALFENILDKRIRDGTSNKSDLLLMFKLKAEMPDKYRDQIDHKVEGSIKIITGVPRPPEGKREPVDSATKEVFNDGLGKKIE